MYPLLPSFSYTGSVTVYWGSSKESGLHSNEINYITDEDKHFWAVTYYICCICTHQSEFTKTYDQYVIGSFPKGLSKPVTVAFLIKQD